MARGFLGALDSFAGGLAQGMEQGERIRLAQQAEARAQAEEDRRKKTFDEEQAFKDGLKGYFNNNQYVFTGSSFDGFERADAPAPAATPDAASSAAAGLPAAAPAKPEPAPLPKTSGQAVPVPGSIEKIDPNTVVGLPPAAAAPAAPAAPKPDAAIPPVAPKAPAAAPATTATAPAPAAAPDAEKVVVRDPATGVAYRVPRAMVRERNPLEIARDQFAYYAKAGRANEGIAAITQAAQAQVAMANLDKQEMSDKLSRAALNPAAFASETQSLFGKLGVDVDVKPVQIDVGDGKKATVLQYNMRGTQAPPFYIDSMGQFSQTPDPAAYNSNVQLITGMVKGDTAGAISSITTLQAQVQAIAAQRQAMWQSAQRFPFQLANDALQPELTRSNIRQNDAAASASAYGAAYNYGAPNPGFASSVFDNAILPSENRPNADGSWPTSSKGAIGPAQVMPGTAPEAARLAGLPWDENRYKNDPEYNRAIGRAYFNEMYRTFGNPLLAAAAYNAGPGAVQKALQQSQEKGGNVFDYLPAETRKYVFGDGKGYPGVAARMTQAGLAGVPGAPGVSPGGMALSPRDQAEAAKLAAARQAEIAKSAIKIMADNGWDMNDPTAFSRAMTIAGQAFGVTGAVVDRTTQGGGNKGAGVGAKTDEKKDNSPPPPPLTLNGKPAPAPYDDSISGYVGRAFGAFGAARDRAMQAEGERMWNQNVSRVYSSIEQKLRNNQAPNASELRFVRMYTDRFPFLVQRMNPEIVNYIATNTK